MCFDAPYPREEDDPGWWFDWEARTSDGKYDWLEVSVGIAYQPTCGGTVVQHVWVAAWPWLRHECWIYGPIPPFDPVTSYLIHPRVFV